MRYLVVPVSVREFHQSPNDLNVCKEGNTLGKAVLKSQQTFGETCPDLFYCSLWKSLISAKAKPVAREFTINAEYGGFHLTLLVCSALGYSYFWISANLQVL